MSAKRRDLTVERLREVLHYDPETGIFTWLVTRSRTVKGTAAGYLTPRGYIKISIDGVTHVAQQLAWLYVTGKWPDGEIDHIDLTKSNNRSSNLREATRSQNRANRPKQANNTSGFKGVSPTPHGTWVASIKMNRKSYHLGTFSTREDAHAAYDRAAIELYGEFARPNFPSSSARGGFAVEGQ